MKIVIEIPEEEYQRWQEDGEMDALIVRDALVNGTPLPKGHGRLIDANAFQKYYFNKNFEKRLSEGGLAIINMFLELQNTIIEADRSEE